MFIGTVRCVVKPHLWSIGAPLHVPTWRAEFLAMRFQVRTPRPAGKSALAPPFYENFVVNAQANCNGKTQAIAVHWGYAQVDGNNVRVLAELAETAHEIDLPRAQKAEKNAKELLQSEKPTSSDWEDEESRQKVYENKLQRSVVRQAVAKFQ